MNGSEREKREEEIHGWKWMFKNSLYLKEQGYTLLRLYAHNISGRVSSL